MTSTDFMLRTLQVSLANTSIELSKENLYRFARILFPPPPEVLSKMCQQGFNDALDFLQRNNLINCTRCLAVQSRFNLTVSGIVGVELCVCLYIFIYSFIYSLRMAQFTAVCVHSKVYLNPQLFQLELLYKNKDILKNFIEDLQSLVQCAQIYENGS